MFKGFVKAIAEKLQFKPEEIGASLHSGKQTTARLKDVLKTLKTEDLTNFIWLSILKPNSQFNAHTLSILRKTDIVSSQKSLETLSQHQLLVKLDHTGEYFIHESLRIFASHLLTSPRRNNPELIRLGIKWIDAHQKLILSFQNSQACFRQKQENYFLKNLDWHLQEAQWDDKIHSIINHTFPLNQWQNQIAQDITNNESGSIKLISIAEKDCQFTFQDNPSESLLLFSKYQLMKSIHNHALQNIPAQWVKTLVETEIWADSKALAYIQSQANPDEQAERISFLRKTLGPESLEVLVNVISEMTLDSAKAKATSSIFEHLELPNKKRVVSLISKIQSESYRGMCIGSIAPHIPVPLMHSAFNLIKSIQDPKIQALTLERFLPYFTVPLQKKSLEVIRNFENSSTKFRLLSKLQSTFPPLKSDLIRLAMDIETDYSKLSVLWKLQDRHQQASGGLTTLLQTCNSSLDKVLFLTDIIPQAKASQLEEIWAIASSFEDENLWGNAIVALLPFIETEKINAVIDRTSNLISAPLKGELCIQLFPFAHPGQYDRIYTIIQTIDAPEIRGITTSQILDYTPAGLCDVLETLKEIADPIKCLEIKIHLLEHDEVWGEQVMQSIQNLPDESIQTQFLSQIIYLIPNRLIPQLTNLILQIRQSKRRNLLLNQLTPRLKIREIKQAIIYLSQASYPASLCKNIAKQINRNYWESNVKGTETKLTQTLLDQLSQIEPGGQKNKNNDNVLQDIFKLPSSSNQSKILSLCLNDIQWDSLSPDTLLQIVTILSRGSSLELLRHFPTLIQGIEAILGNQSLPAYGNICSQLSQPNPITNHQDHQSKSNTYHIVEFQEFWPETA